MLVVIEITLTSHLWLENFLRFCYYVPNIVMEIMQGLLSILSLFHNEFNRFNNTGA